MGYVSTVKKNKEKNKPIKKKQFDSQFMVDSSTVQYYILQYVRYSTQCHITVQRS